MIVSASRMMRWTMAPAGAISTTSPALWPTVTTASTSPSRRARGAPAPVAPSGGHGLALPCRPPLDQAVSHHATAPADGAREEVGNSGELGVVAVAREERLLVPVRDGRLDGGKESGPEENALRAEHQRRGEPGPVGEASGGEHRTGATARATCGTITTEARRPHGRRFSPLGDDHVGGRRRRPRPRRRESGPCASPPPRLVGTAEDLAQVCSGDGHAVEKTRGPVASTASTDSSAANSSRLSPNGRVVRARIPSGRRDTVRIEVGHAHDAEAAGLRDRGDERRVREAARHAASTTGWSTPRTEVACRDHRALEDDL